MCGLFGYTKQAYYKRIKRADCKSIETYTILSAVKQVRKKMPVCGVRKLKEYLATEFHINVGRDELFNILRDEGMLIRKRRYKKRTTFSNHNMRVYKNAIKDIVPMRPNEVWVSDITYIQYLDTDYYLFLITDLYSRKIVGWCLADNLCTDNAITALRMALKQRKDDKFLIHHSDRGCQYASYKYIELLKKMNILPSMTENSDPKDNAVAERINGIIKNEFLKYRNLTIQNIKSQVANVIDIYNNYRIHLSIGNLTPNIVHSDAACGKKLWKNYFFSQNMSNFD